MTASPIAVENLFTCVVCGRLFHRYERERKCEGCKVQKPAPRQCPPGREKPILMLLQEGMSDEEIGAKLYLNSESIGQYVLLLTRKYHCRNRTELAVKFVKGELHP
jgi:DNA-binding NarL/FixJ family response regulator